MGTSIPTDTSTRRNTAFTLCKALAILCVVLSQAGGPEWMGTFLSQFDVPIFFLCAGYFFNTRYLADEKTFLKHRFRGLYLPFLRWSLFFLVFHNVFCALGFIGGDTGTPYTWQAFFQNLWSITFGMTCYDAALCGSYWFFRSLFLSSLAFLLLFKLLHHVFPKASVARVALYILCLGVLLILWQTAESLVIPVVAEGGYRELCGIAFMAIGFLYHEYRARLPLRWYYALGALVLLILGASFLGSSMEAWQTLVQFLPLLPLGAVGFYLVLWLSTQIERRQGWLRSALEYVGNRTLYVFAFFLVAFKVVSMVKVGFCHLPWQQVGDAPVVEYHATTDAFFLLYFVVGVALPLLWLAAYRALERRYGFTLAYGEILRKDRLLAAAKHLWQGLRWLGRMAYRLARALVFGLWAGIKAFLIGVKDIISASSPKDE